MKGLLGATALALTAVGCAPAAPWHASWHSGWSKPDMTGEAFEADVRACDLQAMQAMAGQPGHQATATVGTRLVNPAQPTQWSNEHTKAYTECMKKKGYTPTKSS